MQLSVLDRAWATLSSTTMHAEEATVHHTMQGKDRENVRGQCAELYLLMLLTWCRH
jgi:hypothetical protein